MSKRILCPALALAGALGTTAASAQSVGVYVGPGYGGPYYDDYYDYGYVGPAYDGPRVYGYVQRREAARDPEVIGNRAGVTRNGDYDTYRFWNGEECVDARNK